MDDETAASALRTLIGEMLAEGLLRREGELVFLDYGGHVYLVEMKLHDVTGA
jgi:hypothetical protein